MLHKGRFSAARMPDDAEKLPRLYRDIHAVERVGGKGRALVISISEIFTFYPPPNVANSPSFWGRPRRAAVSARRVFQRGKKLVAQRFRRQYVFHVQSARP